jgi:hypothetical protein
MHSTAKWRIGALTVAAATAVALAGGSAAVADPTGSPTYRPINGTGSDTTQDVMNGLASVVTNGGARVLGSYDALGTATITTRSGGRTARAPATPPSRRPRAAARTRGRRSPRPTCSSPGRPAPRRRSPPTVGTATSRSVWTR